MAIRRCFAGLASATVFAMSIWLLASVREATAETLSGKNLNHVTKLERVPIADVEGHVVELVVREGVQVFENGEWAWVKATITSDRIKAASQIDQYAIIMFLDGSTITTHTKGTVEATQGVPLAAKWTGDITGGTGRFQGIKGTATASAKMLPPEKGELGPKALVEGALVYTLPGK